MWTEPPPTLSSTDPVPRGLLTLCPVTGAATIQAGPTQTLERRRSALPRLGRRWHAPAAGIDAASHHLDAASLVFREKMGMVCFAVVPLVRSH